jgi:hypothetical protein
MGKRDPLALSSPRVLFFQTAHSLRAAIWSGELHARCIRVPPRCQYCSTFVSVRRGLPRKGFSLVQAYGGPFGCGALEEFPRQNTKTGLGIFSNRMDSIARRMDLCNARLVARAKIREVGRVARNALAEKTELDSPTVTAYAMTL